MTLDLSRRDLLKSAAGLALPLMAPSFLASPVMAQAPIVAMPGDGHKLFTLGVASGDPWPDNVVLWTRLAPDPINGGGMGREPVEVTWEVATDERMQTVVRKGTATAQAEYAHSLHVEVGGLEPGRWYWYRFRTAVEDSRVGRTRTAPAPHATVDRLRFVATSCQDYSHGFYTGHQHMIEEDLDLVVFLGDYIYEGLPYPGGPRSHNPQDTFTIEEWRNRHALYKTDPHLQACHAAFPWVVTWDDHEVDNDYAGQLPGWEMDPKIFIGRRIAAYRAYYEHMPLRRQSIPQGVDMLLYRQVAFGGLIDFNVLDTRQYRDIHACQTVRGPECAEHRSPSRSIMGMAQESWLFEQLRQNRARWNVIAQQVPMMKRALGNERGSMDKWDGYIASRDRLMDALIKYRVSNPIVLAGDIHQAVTADLLADFNDPGSRILGSEFVMTSLASGGDGQRSPIDRQMVMAANPHVKWGLGGRGYTRFDVTPHALRADYRSIEYISRPGAPIRTAQSFVVEDRRPGLQMA